MEKEMIEITAKMVMSLRVMTGAGMMNCKVALIASKGDMDLAKDELRKLGILIADKKAGRDANEGLVGVRVMQDAAYIVMINCETDFVARNERFQSFVKEYLDQTEKQATFSDEDVAKVVTEVGENIKLGRATTVNQVNVLGGYVHGKIADELGTIGVVVSLKGEPTVELGVLAHTIAMHIAALNPKSIDADSLDQEFIEAERKFLTDQAIESGKPTEIIEKMVEGRMRKMLKEVTLVDQPFVVDPDRTVGAVLKEAGAEVVEFMRFAVGE